MPVYFKNDRQVTKINFSEITYWYGLSILTIKKFRINFVKDEHFIWPAQLLVRPVISSNLQISKDDKNIT